MAGWDHILCATGLGEGCRVAVAQAARLAREGGARLTLLHVRSGGSGPLRPWPAPGGADPGPALAEQRALAERILGAPVRVLSPPGSVVAEVLRALREEEHDLLVIGVRRRAALGWMVMGSTAARLVREAPCAVLVARRGEGADLAEGAAAGPV